jgi:RNA polymerase sigma-70 factor, ECF subfamily
MRGIGDKTDEEIVALVKDDKEVYAEIVKRYQAKLLRYTQYLIGDSHKAKDVVQETLIRAYINLNSFNIKQKFSSWIYRISHNLAINEIKKYQKEIKLIDEIESDEHEKIQDNLEKKEVILELRRCLEQLPVIYREPIMLYYLEEKSYEEISDILRIPDGTVAIRISRAKTLLKKLCQEKLNNQI